MNLVATTAASLIAARAEAGVQFKSYQTHSHIVVAVDPDVSYAVEPILSKGKTVGLKLVLNNVKEDLEDLTGSQDSRTEKVMVVKTPTADGRQVIYQFLLSEKARNAGIEFFDYRSKSPAEIALDYWMKPGAASHETVRAKPAAPSKKGQAPAKVARKHPSAPVFGGCGQPLDVAADGVADYKVYHRPFDYRGFFHLMPADADYAYPPATGVDAKQAQHYRLALKLYKDQKYALVLRTIEFFDQQYPKSPLARELKFLKASTFMHLANLLKADRYADQALEMYRQMLIEEPASARGKAALSFLVQEIMGKGTPILALEYALMGADQKPETFKDPAAPLVFRLASAESLYALGEFDRAERAYQAIMDQGGKLGPEGAFRIGEVMSARSHWERAIIYYEKAMRDYPKDAARFPTAYFNLAEAYFRLARYAEAERVYKEFDHVFGADGALWAVRLRLAELEQIKLKAADPKKHEPIADLYESVVNRHPYSPGALMAELRMARCYKGLPPEDRTRAFFENFFATRDPKKLEDALLDAAQVEQWMDLTEATFFLNNGDPRAALKRADDYRVKLGKAPLAGSFRKVYGQAVIELAVQLAQKNNNSELLAAIEHYGDLAAKPAPFLYDLALASASLEEGDLKTAAERFSALDTKLSEATDAEKDRFHLLKARQRQLLGEKAEAVMAELAQIRDTGELAPQKYEELARAATDRGDLKAAVAFGARLLDGELVRKLPVERRMKAAILRVDNLVRLRDTEAAATAANAALLRYGTETEQPQLLARIKELRAQALYDAGDYQHAVEAIDEILGAAPNHPRHTEFEFMRGKGLAKLGRENEALETFTKLSKPGTVDDVWRKSAQAELDQLQWENKVSNQIKDKDRRSSQ